LSLDFTVRQYRKKDEDQIIPLLDRVFSGWLKMDLECTPQEHYEWLYWDNPEKKNPTIVAEKDGQIIGVNHGLYLNIKIGNKIFLCNKGTDLAVDENYRGKGINKKIDELHSKYTSESGSCLGFYLTKNPIVIKIKLERGGLTFPAPIEIHVRINDIDAYLKNKSQITGLQSLEVKYGYLAEKAYYDLKSLTLKPKTPDNTKIKIVKIDSFDDRIDTFWDAIKDEYDFIIEKSRKYLNWRFCDIRGGKYDVYIAEENGVILGYMILRVNRFNRTSPEGYLMEIYTLPKSPDVANLLLETAVDYFDREKVTIVYASVVKGHPLEGYLHNYGFVDSMYRTFVGLNPINLGDELAVLMKADPGRLDYQYGVSDTI
jgi:hypothetical protein